MTANFLGQPPVILASASPQRREVLLELGIAYDVIRPDVEEVTFPDPVSTVLENARRKLNKGLEMCGTDQLVIAADTVLYHRGQVSGKPVSQQQALDMLLSYCGKTIEVFTGVAVGRSSIPMANAAVERATVEFLAFGEAEARWYVSTGEPFERAGALGISLIGEVFIHRVTGSLSCVAGLPKRTLLWLLRDFIPVGTSESRIILAPQEDFLACGVVKHARFHTDQAKGFSPGDRPTCAQ